MQKIDVLIALYAPQSCLGGHPVWILLLWNLNTGTKPLPLLQILLSFVNSMDMKILQFLVLFLAGQLGKFSS